MKKFVSTGLPIATLVVGLVGGWFASSRYSDRWMEIYMRTESYNDLGQRCRVLVQLRAGKTNEAATTLETSMDGDILFFGSYIRDVRPEDRRAEDTKLLMKVRDYRAAHPWKSAGYPEIDKGVAEVFALVSTNQSR